ncbi:hypothetical protein ACK3TF_002168 [Chlorella vulgaris]
MRLRSFADGEIVLCRWGALLPGGSRTLACSKAHEGAASNGSLPAACGQHRECLSNIAASTVDSGCSSVNTTAPPLQVRTALTWDAISPAVVGAAPGPRGWSLLALAGADRALELTRKSGSTVGIVD